MPLDFFNYYIDCVIPKYDELTNDAYRCFLDTTGTIDNDNISDTFRGIIEKKCIENGGKCYKSAAKNAKYAIIAGSLNKNNNRVRYWHEKGYKVNEINESNNSRKDELSEKLSKLSKEQQEALLKLLER